ncbi:ATP-binding protein [Paenibacillus thalictri]|uniref:ATP-binding protein n=1 Tax=Paenibacillus thalictri TaxID=2527873 RepID=A0A4Q9DUX2_9BACL|nr:AAA family ATPase [Paenibacillus thalictri]TBL80779.1 ATP-binding protein [Paenibacillus thalictri]
MMRGLLHTFSAALPYENAMDHLRDEITKLDFMLECRIHQRNTTPKSDLLDRTFHGVYMTDSEAAQLLDHPDPDGELTAEQELGLHQIEQWISARLALTARRLSMLPLIRLQSLFKLNELEMRLLVTLLAPHVDGKYLRLYGFIQDDMTRQYVTADVLLQLCCSSEDERIQALQILTGMRFCRTFLDKSLFIRSPESASMLHAPIRLDERIVYFCTGLEYRYDGALAHLSVDACETSTLPPLLVNHEIQERLERLAAYSGTVDTTVACMLSGPGGSGKTLHARHLCASLQRPLLAYDMSRAPDNDRDFLDDVDRMLREAQLIDAIPAFDCIHVLQDANRRSFLLMERLQAWKDVVLMMGEEEIRPPVSALSGMLWMHIPLAVPDIGEREMLWRMLASDRLPITNADSGVLAGKFRFTPGSIQAAVDEVCKHRAWQRHGYDQIRQADPTTASELHRVAYHLINHRLQEKAVKLEGRFTWDDLILPKETMGLLRQACSRIVHRHKVMHDWGFDRKLAYGKGTSMLFTGPPGTGKTMSALVMAKEMSAELYRIDLSRIVSKYIGETEKNLSEIFDHARVSGAILFFDEADALFGKRSEVKDAHDKYANMETSYLLQKMEEYDGLTILATNFSQNLDDAFMRRIPLIIKFPFPDPVQREQLWRSSIPSELPLQEPIDFPFLAHTFELSGGPIKNIVVTAAYLAAEEGVAVSMKQFIEGAVQEFKKTGKVLLKERLGAYAEFWRG